MIYGIGTDIIENERIEKAIQREAFLMHTYTEAERREAFDKPKRLAGDFVVKEAVAKAFRTGFRGFELRDIEVLRDEYGAPYVNLYGGARELADELGVKAVHVSIADIKELATAYAVIEI